MIKRQRIPHKKVKVGSISFDSKTEALRYKELKILEQKGEIINLTPHPKFTLLKPYTTNHDIKQRALTYTADFSYIDAKTNKEIVEDTKSSYTAKDRVFRLKAKLFQAVFVNKYFYISLYTNKGFKLCKV